MLSSILVGLVVAWVAAGFYLYVFQSRMLFLPARDIVATPAMAGLEFEEVRFAAPDGLTLSGWLVPARRARAMLIFFHGNAGNISHRLESLTRFHDLGLSVLLFDYRGYGASEGRPSEEGTYQDAVAAWDYLTEQRAVPSEQIILFGRSLGGAIAAWLAARRPARALILESTFISVPDLAVRLYPLFPARWLTRLRYDVREQLKHVPCPVLIVHSRDDELVPYGHGRALLDAVRGPKQFLELRGGHNDGFVISGRAYREGIAAFLTQVLAQQAPG